MPPRLVDVLAGRYRVEREVGAGGMVTVFLAELAAIIGAVAACSVLDNRSDIWMFDGVGGSQLASRS